MKNKTKILAIVSLALLLISLLVVAGFDYKKSWDDTQKFNKMLGYGTLDVVKGIYLSPEGNAYYATREEVPENTIICFNCIRFSE